MELHFTRTEEWHDWLSENHLEAREAWLVFYKKPSGKNRIPYNDAVEEALSFGWIDGKLKRVSDEYYIQRFTPRRRDSAWSEINVARAEKLVKEGRMTKAGMDAFRVYLDNPVIPDKPVKAIIPEIPSELEQQLLKNKKAYENFLNFPPSVRRAYLQWINNARRPETFKRRIMKILERSENNIKNTML